MRSPDLSPDPPSPLKRKKAASEKAAFFIQLCCDSLALKGGNLLPGFRCQKIPQTQLFQSVDKGNATLLQPRSA